MFPLPYKVEKLINQELHKIIAINVGHCILAPLGSGLVYEAGMRSANAERTHGFVQLHPHPQSLLRMFMRIRNNYCECSCRCGCKTR